MTQSCSSSSSQQVARVPLRIDASMEPLILADGEICAETIESPIRLESGNSSTKEWICQDRDDGKPSVGYSYQHFEVSETSRTQSGPFHRFGSAVSVLFHTCLGPYQRLNGKFDARISRSRFYGWRMGLLLGSIASGLILIFNIVWYIILAKTGAGFQRDGFAELPFHYPDEQQMSRLNAGIGTLVNSLSSILLAASNYTMQVLSSPSRKDIDDAHQKGDWFDIGVMSIRNLGRIPRKRLAVCLLLGLTSAPLHLFYNAVPSYVVSKNGFVVLLLDSNSSQWQALDRNHTSYEKMTNDRWHQIYGVNDTSEWDSVYDYGDIYLGVDAFASNISNSRSGYPAGTVPHPTNVAWPIKLLQPARQMIRINGSINADWIELSSSWLSEPKYSWRYNPNRQFAHIVHGYAHVRPKNSIQISRAFLIAVIVGNATKLAVMVGVLLFVKNNDFLVTLGDATASFLRQPDSETQRLCTLSRDEMVDRLKEKKTVSGRGDPAVGSKDTWTKRFHKYSAALNRDGQIGSYFVLVVVCITLVICFVLLVMGKVSNVFGSNASPEGDTSLGSNSLSASTTQAVAFAANVPQLVLSLCYFAVNSECTSLAGAYEWNRMALTHKGLRVTRPLGCQRSTYFLSLPLRFSVPLNIWNTGLGILLSQSIWFHRADYSVTQAPVMNGSKLGIFISGLGIITLCTVFYILVAMVAFVGRRKMKVNIPFAAGCSLVISAACHPPPDEIQLEEHPVRWGVVKENMFDDLPHCSFSSREVTEPVEGVRYR